LKTDFNFSHEKAQKAQKGWFQLDQLLHGSRCLSPNLLCAFCAFSWLILLRGDGEDGEVGAQGAELGGAGDAQGKTTAIVADPHAELIFIRFRIVRRDR
jgi:hypothetical protein